VFVPKKVAKPKQVQKEEVVDDFLSNEVLASVGGTLDYTYADFMDMVDRRNTEEVADDDEALFNTMDPQVNLAGMDDSQLYDLLDELGEFCTADMRVEIHEILQKRDDERNRGV